MEDTQGYNGDDGFAMALTINLPPDKEAALKAKAEAAGLRAERYAQQVLERDLSTPSVSGGYAPDERPISKMIGEIWADMPDDVRAQLPADGASEHDHYIYGWPKRDP